MVGKINDVAGTIDYLSSSECFITLAADTTITDTTVAIDNLLIPIYVSPPNFNAAFTLSAIVD
jgi:hypothetical protein